MNNSMFVLVEKDNEIKSVSRIAVLESGKDIFVIAKNPCGANDVFTTNKDNVKSLNQFNETVFLVNYNVLSTNTIKHLYDLIINKINYIDLDKIEHKEYIIPALENYSDLKFYTEITVKNDKVKDEVKLKSTLDPNLPFYLNFNNNKLISKNIHFSLDITKTLNKLLYGIVKLSGFGKFEMNKDLGYFEWRKCTISSFENKKLICVNFDCLDRDTLEEKDEKEKSKNEKVISIMDNNVNFNYVCSNNITVSSGHNTERFIIKEKEDEIMKNILINRNNNFDVL